MRVALDTNAYDRIINEEDVYEGLVTLIGSGMLKLVSTHVQRDEISSMSTMGDKRERLLQVLEYVDEVPTAGAVWGVSKWDQSTFGSDEQNAWLQALIGGNPKHIEDALIAVSAQSTVEVFVTNDHRLSGRIRRAALPIDVWDSEEFHIWIKEQSP